MGQLTDDGNGSPNGHTCLVRVKVRVKGRRSVARGRGAGHVRQGEGSTRGAGRAVARVEGDRAVVSVLVKRRVGGRRRVRAAHLVELGQAPGHTRSSIVNGMATGTRACVTSMGTGPSVELRIHGLEMNGCGHEANERCENAPKRAPAFCAG